MKALLEPLREARDRGGFFFEVAGKNFIFHPRVYIMTQDSAEVRGIYFHTFLPNRVSSPVCLGTGLCDVYSVPELVDTMSLSILLGKKGPVQRWVHFR
jgi:hypothetical protein